MIVFVFAHAPVHASDEAIGTLTAVEGGVTLLRGSDLFTAPERAAVHKSDVIETVAAGAAQIEFNDGVVVALGPASRVFLLEAAPGKTAPRFVLLGGWIKIDTGAKPRADPIQIASRALSAATARATLVFNVTPGATQLFVESGNATVSAAEPPLNPASVYDGQFVQRTSNNLPMTLGSVLPAQFLSSMPRAFRDNLPVLAGRYKGLDVPVAMMREATYEDAAEILTLPKRWRTGLVRRFEGRTQDAAFRAALDANLLQHPEWDRILHPEKYLPPPEQRADGDARKRLSTTEGLTTQGSKTEASKAEAMKTENPKAESPKTESSKVEGPTTEGPTTEGDSQ